MRKVSPDGGGSWGSNGPAGGGGSEVSPVRVYIKLDSTTGTKRPHMGMTRYGDAGSGATRVYIG